MDYNQRWFEHDHAIFTSSVKKGEKTEGAETKLGKLKINISEEQILWCILQSNQ